VLLDAPCFFFFFLHQDCAHQVIAHGPSDPWVERQLRSGGPGRKRRQIRQNPLAVASPGLVAVPQQVVEPVAVELTADRAGHGAHCAGRFRARSATALPGRVFKASSRSVGWVSLPAALTIASMAAAQTSPSRKVAESGKAWPRFIAERAAHRSTSCVCQIGFGGSAQPGLGRARLQHTEAVG